MLSNRSSGLLGMTADPGLVSLLASMEPKQRQHYVAQHSDDINVVIMGKVVSDIANKLDIAKKGGQPGTKPTVLAQTIAAIAPEPQVQPQGQQQVIPLQGETQMGANGGYMDSRLPEDMGIGALPERSLSNMADGGIVGFSERGLVADLPGGAIERARRAILEKQGLPPRRGYMTTPEIYDQDTQNAYQQPQETPANVAQQTALPSAAPAALPSAAARAAPPAAARPTAARPTGVPPAAGAPPAASPSANATAGLQSLVTKDATVQDIVNARKDIAFLQDPVVDPLKAERQKIIDAEKASGLEELQQHRDRVAKQGDPYAKQEERANKQEASVAESAERNPYLSLMEAGFAAMSGDSPYAFVNLGKGALAGTKTYREGLALIEKAKEKLSETRDRIDGLRLIRSDLNASEERAILNQNRKTALEGTRFMFAGLEKATGESKAQIEATLKMFTEAETARRLADRQYNTEVMKQKEENARNATSNAALGARNAASIISAEKIAGMPSKEAQMAVSLGTGTTYEERLKSGLQTVQELLENPKTIIQAYTKHVEDARKAIPPETPLTPEVFAAQTRALLAAMKNKGNPQDEALVNKYAPKQ